MASFSHLARHARGDDAFFCSMVFRFAEVVGCYRLQVSEALLAFVEQRFVEPAPIWDRDRIRSEALAEARAAELVIEADGTVSSRAGEQEFYRVRLGDTEGELSELWFDKAPGCSVRLLFLAPDSLTAIQPDKPEMTFGRVPERREAPRYERAGLRPRGTRRCEDDRDRSCE